MNRHQRNKNRYTARVLNAIARDKRNMAHTCENCGQPGGHWHSLPQDLASVMRGDPAPGFYSCERGAVTLEVMKP